MTTEGNGRLIAGRYRLGVRLGRGGMGTVWRATDELLGRQVAVKELNIDIGAHEAGLPATAADDDVRSWRERVLREARTVAQLVHPNVIVVHDVVDDEDTRLSYIIMELIDGESLADRVATSGPVDTRESARIGLALLGALRTAHEHGVLHRDIKPANVLLEADSGRVVLTDFGIARLSGATTLTDSGSFFGSPEYTAPERMEGVGAGPASDLWSLGVLLCTALSGESPFHRDSLGGVLNAVVNDEIRPPAAAGPLLPVVLGLLERDPERRLGVEEAERLLVAHLATGVTPEAAAQMPPYSPTQWDVPLTAPPPTAVPILVPVPGTSLAAAEQTRPRVGRIRGALVAGALVVAMAGAGAATAVLFLGDGGGGEGTGGSNGESGGRTDAASTPPTPPTRTVTSTAPSGSSVPTASVTPTPSFTPPAGYRRVSDPAGFSLAVPEGYNRSTDDKRVFYISPDQQIRIGVRQQAAVSSGPLGAMRLAHANGPDTNPGYRDGKVTPTTYNGLTAALWEFTWDGFEPEDEDRHTYDLCWEEGGLMYDVWVSAPVGRQDDAKRHFDTALDSFTRR